ncbi:DUF4365 domain-containing protein [Streptomyces bobili]|uniref:DUF4365 domain-containing protein n=1 Tax=Streptomyces bobili TaxID=67280 RepID=UPI0033D45A2C
MRVQRTQQTERAGVSWIEYQVTHKLGWVFRGQETVDMGIDAHLEIVDEVSREATGRLLGVQIKTGPSYFQTPTSDGWWFVCDADHVSYWLGHTLPVLVMLCDVDNERVYWQSVNEQTVVWTGKGTKIHVPRSHALTAHSAESLRPLARSSSEVPAMAVWLTSQESHPQSDVFYMHLLSARLYAMFPGAVIANHSRGEHIEMTIYFRDSGDYHNRKTVDVALVETMGDAERLTVKLGSPMRFAPLVIVVGSSLDHKDVARLSDLAKDLAIFAAPWTADGRYDAHLKATMNCALKWIEAWKT